MQPENGKITIKDVARLAQVSVATAARVVSNYGSVSEKTRRKVLAVVEELHFVPNFLAQSMKGKPTRTIGVVVGSIKATFFADVLETMERRLVGEGYGILLCHSADDPDSEVAALKMLYGKHVDGIIITTCQSAGKILSAGERSLYSPDIPIVFLDREIMSLSELCIKTDHYGAAYEATSYLCGNGHRRIGLLAGAGVSAMRQRIDGYAAALRDGGLTVDDTLIFSKKGLITLDDAISMAEELLRCNPELTALFALNDVLGAGALQVLRRREKRIPADVSFICWDDFPMAAAMEPPITVVAQNIDGIASAAISKLLLMLNGKTPAGRGQPAEKQITFSARLIERASCRAIADSFFEPPGSGHISGTGGSATGSNYP